MLKFLLLTALALAGAEKLDPIADQIAVYKQKNKSPAGTLTTSSGAPVHFEDAASTLNKNVLKNPFAMDLLTHFVRERTPVRCVHTKGAGAFGYFVTTKDLSHVTKAKFLHGVGKKTPVAVRCSLSFAERAASDLSRETRGFAVKWYTEEGNMDIAGFSTPVFVVKDAFFVPHLVHAYRSNPVNDLRDVNMFWDFVVWHPESLFIFLMLFSDEGIFDGYRYMPGHSIHTYPLYNEKGEITYSRFYFRPVDGIKYLNATEATRLGAMDPDYSARDLYNAIASGNYPTWEVLYQPIPQDCVKNMTLDPFDISKEIPESLVPMIPIGKFVLNRLAKNYYAEIEQLAFSPGNLVPGFELPPDKACQIRSMVYKDAQLYRLGVNHNNIEVNRPYRSKVNTYNRDGTPPVGGNGYDIPNYYPNSFNGPLPYVDKHRPFIPEIHEAEPDNFDQARNYYNNRLVGDLRTGLINNIVASLCQTTNYIQDKAVEVFGKVHSDLAERVAKALKENKCKK